jgi:hypothetical protein
MKIEEEHIQMLAEMAELLTLEENFGFVPEFNAKRPFGNSMRAIVAADVWDAMGGNRDDVDLDDNERIDELIEWLQDCTPVLKAILRSDKMKEFIGMETE